MNVSFQKIVEDQPHDIADAEVPWKDIVYEDGNLIVYHDGYPVTPGHLLYVPKYNTVISLTNATSCAIIKGTEMVESKQWEGFNLGINIGTAAGQTVGWPHVHLIPRRTGDMEDPSGGVRHVIPERGNYKKGDHYA